MSKAKADPQRPFDETQGRFYRRSIRLKGFDYSQAGAYFVTILTYQRGILFGKIRNSEIVLNDLGKIADECWRPIPGHFPFVELGAYVVMPNHVHGIITIVGATHASPLPTNPRGPAPHSLGTIVGSFKSAVTRIVGREHNVTGIWQRNYYEHIIRNEKDLQNKMDYINANPMLWDKDDDNPINVHPAWGLTCRTPTKPKVDNHAA